MTDERTKKLAERIAAVLSESETQRQPDFSALQASLETILTRLDKIESQIAVQNPVSNSKSQVTNHKFAHPSRERFAVGEPVSDAGNDFPAKEKACPFEPNGKPCDYCSMCSARGF